MIEIKNRNIEVVQNLQKVLANKFSANNLLSKDILCGNLGKYMVQKFSSHLKKKPRQFHRFTVNFLTLVLM